jgi:hypothetical protein
VEDNGETPVNGNHFEDESGDDEDVQVGGSGKFQFAVGLNF